MPGSVVFLSIPGLGQRQLRAMPVLSLLMSGGDCAPLIPGFPCVTWPVQANMLTGQRPDRHGVVANGFYWRERHEVEMWTAWNEKVMAPQVWDLLHQRDPGITSAVWFPMLSKGCGADYICMPAPVHNPDGSESLWCYTRPASLYGELRDAIGHFPLQHFWGPLASIKSTAWIADSAVIAARRFRPRFFYLYLPHLDYAAQRTGPDSPEAAAAVGELDNVIQQLSAGLGEVYGDQLLWIAAGEYAITPVDHVSFPNRMLRQAGLLRVREEPDGEHLDLQRSQAWAMVDHQFAHVFVRDGDPAMIRRAADVFAGQPGFAEVMAGEARRRYSIDHPRSGDIVLVSTPNSWQAYYWWFDDGRAPAFARTVDIHRKPGYDPVELHLDIPTRSIPLDASRIKGSHGAPATGADQQTVVLASAPILAGRAALADVDLCRLILDQFSRG